MPEYTLPILYSFRRCPYAIRARLAIAASGQTCELREIFLRDKAPEFLSASPKGTVPVLVDNDGEVYEESLDIMAWALETSDPGNWLVPETGTIEKMMALIEHADGDFKTSLDRYKYASHYESADPEIERGKAGVFLQGLDASIAAGGYLFGSRPCLADIAIAPFVRQFANVDPAWFEIQAWPHLISWLREFAESDQFAEIMQKYPKWAHGDPVTLFPGPAVNSL